MGTQISIEHEIDNLILSYYPKAHRFFVLLTAVADTFEEEAKSVFVEFKNEFNSLFLYDLKLVFPGIISAMSNVQTHKKIDIITVLTFLRKKQEKIMELFQLLKKQLLPLKSGSLENDFFMWFETQFIIARNNLNTQLNKWVDEKISA